MLEFLGRYQRSLSQMRRQKLAARSLAALDDRQLRDIGIYRSQIQSVVGGGDRRVDR